jgi:hypothetical protein
MTCKTRHYFNVFLLLACSFVLASGCSKSSSRLGIEGEVTFDGAPLPDGKINFTPMPGTSSPTAGATITNGEFKVNSAKGVRPGQFRVEIKAIRLTGKRTKDDLSGEAIEQQAQYIPAKYNENSELIAEIKADENNRLKFALSGK